MGTGTVGFIGLGIMGVPMATNLVRGGVDLVVWARHPHPVEALVAIGARAADDVAGVFDAADTVILMLRDEAAVDAVLSRGHEDFGRLVRDRTVVQMGTFTTGFSRTLAAEVRDHGGRYVEAPVSGSRGPATDAALVAMLAGDPEAVARVEPLIALMCATSHRCGDIPAALSTKLAVNVFLITMVTGLAETFHVAAETGVDLDVLRAVLDAGPMASVVSRGKAAKLREHDMSAQAAIADVLKNARLAEDAASAAVAAHPLTEASRRLYADAVDAGLGTQDMIGVIAALEERTRSLRASSS
jgi:3-hydroxyisobutyrate dehydrogenase